MVREPFNALSHALRVPLALLGRAFPLLLAPREVCPALLIFGLTLALMFGASPLYPALRVGDRALAWPSQHAHAATLHLLHGTYHPLLVEALPQEAAREAIRLARRLGLPLEGYTADGGFFIEGDSPLLKAHQELLGVVAEEADLLRLPAPLVRLQVLAEAQAPLGALMDPLPQELQAHVAESPRMPGVRFVSLTKRGVSKLSAARFVAESYGLTLAQCAMVGDGENDLELIQGVGLGIAMGNASPQVKKVAQRVVAPVEACGLAEALASLLPAIREARRGHNA
ncbi:HAD family hydrolase [Thermus scotoductus]|uniref:HAD family hydrolase n=1 Tax=Thermus scotoductus TaxID=37636 RepID=UPI0020A23937|nr:HAD hydrolase family protein [Thermus scotoductus]